MKTLLFIAIAMMISSVALSYQASGGSTKSFRTDNVFLSTTNREDFILPNPQDQVVKIRFRPADSDTERLTPVMRFGPSFTQIEWNKIYEVTAVLGKPKLLLTGIAEKCVSGNVTIENCNYDISDKFDYQVDFMTSEGKLVYSYNARDAGNHVNGFIIRGAVPPQVPITSQSAD